MKKVTETRKPGRPKLKAKDDRVFLTMKVSNLMAKELTKDAVRHFRNRSQHIQWILQDYIVNKTFNSKAKNNKPLYTEEEIKDMEQWYNKQQGE